jgi:hypothetical protein
LSAATFKKWETVSFEVAVRSTCHSSGEVIL